MIPIVWASVNASFSTASLDETPWMHMDSGTDLL